MNSDLFDWMGAMGWILVAGGVALVLTVAWSSTVLVLKTTKRRTSFDRTTWAEENVKENADDSPPEQQAWLHSLIEQLESQYRLHNVDIFKDGNFDTYSFNKDDIAKVFLIEGQYKKLCKVLNRPVFEELEKDLEHFIGEKNRENKEKRERHNLLLRELELELESLVRKGSTNKEIIDTISQSQKYSLLRPNFRMWRENEVWYVAYSNRQLRFRF